MIPLTSAEYVPSRTASFPEEMMLHDDDLQFNGAFEDYVNEQKCIFETEYEDVEIADFIYVGVKKGIQSISKLTSQKGN